MFESQGAGVKRLTIQFCQRALRRFRQLLGLGLEPCAIIAVAKQGMADMGHMHADLMGAAGFQLAGDQAGDGFPVPIGAEFF